MTRQLIALSVLHFLLTVGALDVFRRAHALHHAGRVDWAHGIAEPAFVTGLFILIVTLTIAALARMIHPGTPAPAAPSRNG